MESEAKWVHLYTSELPEVPAPLHPTEPEEAAPCSIRIELP